MTYSVRPAKRDNAKPLIGIYAQSGAGKTYTALLVARGFVGPTGRIVMIETEGGRGESYADPREYPEIGGYEVISMRDDYSPQNYGSAIAVANSTQPDALIIDSASHEWEGAGGVLDMASENDKAGKRGVLVWQQPKIMHQRHFMNPLMQTPIPLVIVCMRAKYPMEERPKKNGQGKEWVRSEMLEPKQSEDVLYEMFVHFWIDMDHAVHVTKCTAKSLRDVFVEGRAVTVDTGRQLAGWAGQRREMSQASGAAPKTEPTKEAGKENEIVLFNAAGEQLASVARWGEWLDALEAELKRVGKGDKAQELWDRNSDTFERGQSKTKPSTPAAERFNAVGQLAVQMRMPETEEQF